MLAVMLPLAVITISIPQPVYADTVVLQENFTASTTWTVPLGVTSVQVLVVGGGGGGGGAGTSMRAAGGGGGGGVNYSASYAVTSGANISIVVGAGGSGGSGSNAGGNGGTSSFNTAITAAGGGGGGCGDGNSGGSGGGGGVWMTTTYNPGSASPAGQGNPGGSGYYYYDAGKVKSYYQAGGGGGKNASGSPGSTSSGGAGGVGVNYSAIFGLVGDNGFFAGGGGGGCNQGTGGAGGTGGGGSGHSGGGNGNGATVANSGGGGGGAYSSGSSQNGGSGAYGIVIVKYTQTRWNLTVTAGSNGTTNSASGTYNQTSVVNIIATPNTCYHFVNWTGDTGNISSPTSANTNITMNGTYSITANFAINTSTLNVNATAGGTTSFTGSSGPFNCSTNATVVATANPCYHFTGWTQTAGLGSNITIFSPSATTTNIRVNGTANVTANFAINTSTLNINATAGGTASFSGGSGPFNCGTNATVVATANPCYTFTGWTQTAGLGSNITIFSPSATTTNIMVNGTANVTANFILNSSSTLNVNASPSAGGTTTGTGPYSCGGTATITATANPCYTFTGWTQTAGLAGNVTIANANLASTTVTVNGTATVTANFAANASSILIVNASPAAGGTTSGGGSYSCGGTATITATANPCYTFTGWTQTAGLAGNVTIANANLASTTVTVNGNATVTANFAVYSYTLTVNASPSAGGSASGGGSYNCGTNATVSTTTNSCYTFTGWTQTAGLGSNITIFNPSATTTNVTVNGNATVTANFAFNSYTLNTSSSFGGTVTTPGIGTYTYNCSQVVSIVATPNWSCFAFVNWTGSGAGAVNNVSASSTNITMSGSYSIQANFVPICYTTAVFNSSGTWTVPTCVTSVQVLVVAGGGGGGGNAIDDYCGGGGGGGGLIYTFNFSVTPGNLITITVGGGGAAGTSSNSYIGQNGGNSAFGALAVTGGGGGGGGSAGGGSDMTGRNGGSGGGGAVTSSGLGSYGSGGSGTSGQGNGGGSGYYQSSWIFNNAGGGGGGNGSTGANGASGQGGNGGTGANYSSIFGTGVGASGWFAGGGGGGAVSTGGSSGIGGGGSGGGSGNGNPGTAHTGGGGGGGADSLNSRNGGSGGSGVVIIRFVQCANYTLNVSTGSGGTVTTPGVGTYTYSDGSVVNIAAVPNSCYSFNNWSGNTSTIGNVISSSTTIVISGNYSIQANFVLNSYILSVTPNNSDGAPYFNGSNPFNCGVNVPICANTLPGYIFAGWTPTDGIANPSQDNTTVLMNQNRNLTASYYSNSTSPSPTPVSTGGSNSTRSLSWHITPGNFSFSTTAAGIMANMTAGVKDSMGEYLQKQLTIYVSQRTSTQIAWGDTPIYATNGLRLAGSYNIIDGNIRINGTVTVDKKPANNAIQGTLTCDAISPDPMDTDRLTYKNLSMPCTDGPLPDIGVPQQYFKTNLSPSTNVFNNSIHEYVFAGSGNQNLESVQQVWQNNDSSTGILKDGMYYCQGTIILNDAHVTGNVTFVADGITIHNTASGGSNYNDVIYLKPYYQDLLFWANGSKGTLNGLGNADIEVTGNNGNNPCADLEGVIYAPNGEVELAGSGAKYWDAGLTYVIYRATLDKGALLAKYITISGDYWHIYRW